MAIITHKELKTSMLMERLNIHHHTRLRNTPKYTPEVREGRVIPADAHRKRKKEKKMDSVIIWRLQFSCTPLSAVESTCQPQQKGHHYLPRCVHDCRQQQPQSSCKHYQFLDKLWRARLNRDRSLIWAVKGRALWDTSVLWFWIRRFHILQEPTPGVFNALHVYRYRKGFGAVVWAVTSGMEGGIPFSWRLTWGTGRKRFLHSLSMNKMEKERPISGTKRRTMFPASTELNLKRDAYHHLCCDYSVTMEQEHKNKNNQMCDKR